MLVNSRSVAVHYETIEVLRIVTQPCPPSPLPEKSKYGVSQVMRHMLKRRSLSTGVVVQRIEGQDP